MLLLKVHSSTLLWISIIIIFLTSCSQKSSLPAGDIDNGGLFLPDKFEAVVVVDSIGRARHMAVNKNGDIYVKLTNAKQDAGIVALRDLGSDGKVDSITYGIYTSHIGKTLAFDDDGHMYVNFGSLTNNCQIDDRTPESPGQYPCPEFAKHAGIWRFDAKKLNQSQDDGVRYATGLRDGIAMDWNHATNSLFVVEHGRDQLHQHWPSLYSEWENAMLPSEEFFEVKEGMNGGWPYYYYDQLQNKKVVSPEYRGVDLSEVDVPQNPIIGFPGHWAPNDLFFYTGNQFPDR